MSKVTQLFRSASFVPTSGLHTGSIYVHWPYCAKRCSYCSFNKYILNPERKGLKTPWIVPEKRLVNGLLMELRSLLKISRIESVTSIYFGGGTPSLMSPESINSVVQELSENLLKNAEVTLEVNPEDISNHKALDKLKEFKDGGINRISLGVQAFNDQDLKEMNRAHSLKESIQAIQNACHVFRPERVSLDLIFGRNDSQTLGSWLNELEFANTFGVGHLSLYELTIDRGTPLWKDRSSGRYLSPSEDLVHKMYLESLTKVRSFGFERYEVSNFALSEFTQSRHNSTYWEGGEYIGIGPGAHGRLVVRSQEDMDQYSAKDILCNNTSHLDYSGRHTSHHRQERVQTLEPHEWVREVELIGHGTRRVRPLSPLDSCIELLGSGLRTLKGVNVHNWSILSNDLGVSFKDLVLYSKETQRLWKDDYIQLSQKGLSLSDKGMNITDYIAACLVSNLVRMEQELHKS
ncbi:radical S-adenosyl methionine domain-containing protein 1, mitochondrial [Lepeophtheirus salmonis]|uniref:radical S-adenosyl methionine domain-containing protein 1, mitochondrial n=1 Tax=Lepeophtheirus salmonis TaxID=72036 RepID=UPI001AE9B4C9|nr:radical S-adenosyl methionine domain-containing protein 1, mitochondrial-like [Lepeophtheirus salmonis]